MDRRARADRRRAHAHRAAPFSERLQSFAELRKVDVGYDVRPCPDVFSGRRRVRPRASSGTRRRPSRRRVVRRPDSPEELAFLTVVELSALIRTRQVSSTELTKLYLARLKRFDPLLKCVVTLTEDLALKQAAAGRP